MTSTLQQEAGRKLRFSAERTMRSAQRLCENGYITYMRHRLDDAVESAINAARAQAPELYGDACVPRLRGSTPARSERAGGARGLRPSGRAFRTPGQKCP
jgi:DNA topoisomerase-1